MLAEPVHEQRLLIIVTQRKNLMRDNPPVDANSRSETSK
jgi:hypothetical protein